MKIKVEIAKSCGTIFATPICDTAKLFLKLVAGKKARTKLTVANIEVIRELGYEVEVQAPTI